MYAFSMILFAALGLLLGAFCLYSAFFSFLKYGEVPWESLLGALALTIISLSCFS